jgi:excinuclease ABC subunit C
MTEEPTDVAALGGRYPAAVEETLAILPTQPGCYLFKDEHGTVLYVGKARSLRDRVRSYFRNPRGLSLKNSHLVPRIASIDFQMVPSENAALLLEFNLIKQHRPKYNILMRDDKSFLSIRITNEPYPRIEAVRHRSNDGSRYFGPFTSAQSVHRTLDLLKRLFPYRSCRLNIQPPPGGHHLEGEQALAAARQAPAPQATQGASRHGSRRTRQDENQPPQVRALTVAGPGNRACLEYHIHRCAGPCIDAVSQDEYGRTIDQAELFLRGKSEQVATQLQQAMEAAAETLDFEQAARLRDQIDAVRRITDRQRVTVLGGHDQDILGMARVEDETCVELITVREGRMLGHKQFVMAGSAEQEDGAVLAAFLGQYYLTDGECPEEILLPAEPEDAEELTEVLSAKRRRKVQITVPRRGDKLDLVAVATDNARKAAADRQARALTDARKAVQALDELRQALALPRLPIRIECYDISHIQGTSTVGSMVVFENGKPKSAAYRRFRIKTVIGADDFSSLAEMLRRRLKRAEGLAAAPEMAPPAEGPAGTEPVAGDPGTVDSQSEWTRRPDLMIIDGGKGQLSAVLAVLDELGIRDQAIVGLAKQREELFLPGEHLPVLLPPTSQALFLVQRIRDEAHRFAITYHRAVRGKESLESSLDSVPGVGPRRNRDLMRHFGSVKGLRAAPLAEIAGLPGVGPKTALAIKEYLGEA